MAQQTPSFSSGISIEKKAVRLGVWIEMVALAWMGIEASIALLAGFFSRSIALEGFGIDSLIEIVAGGVLLWRLLIEYRDCSVEAVESAERRAALITAVGLFGLALYIVINSAIALLFRSHPLLSWWGIGLALAATVIMPLLTWGKLRVAKRISSTALRADAMCSIVCAYMSITLLVGLLLNALFGWWWADSLAALVLVYFIVREGLEAWHEARSGETCNCVDEQ
ncbi:MAG TPA: cation transporter [Ktedonobacteraceae bacterium]|jgi:divalent metal cation (Fe/Co/Zn/Cd) transporter|nr:cation transporter [Ktedonobacteraceae bacterium]